MHFLLKRIQQCIMPTCSTTLSGSYWPISSERSSLKLAPELDPELPWSVALVSSLLEVELAASESPSEVASAVTEAAVLYVSGLATVLQPATVRAPISSAAKNVRLRMT